LGITQTAGTNITWRNNLIYSNTGIGASFDYEATDSALFYNNTCVNNSTTNGSSDGELILGSVTGNFTGKNNILYNTVGGDYAFGSADATPNSISMDYNDFYSTSTYLIGYDESAYTPAQFANYKAAVTPNDANSIATNPTLDVDYTLYTTSTARNTGTTISTVLDDFRGLPRPQGSAYDIGAYEYRGL
jgi:hypothetical protein